MGHYRKLRSSDVMPQEQGVALLLAITNPMNPKRMPSKSARHNRNCQINVAPLELCVWV